MNRDRKTFLTITGKELLVDNSWRDKTLQETMVVGIDRRIAVKLRDVYTKKLFYKYEVQHREVTNEDALYCLGFMEMHGIDYAIGGYNNNDCILNSTRTYFSKVGRRTHYMPYLGFTKELRNQDAISIFLSGTVRNSGVYYISRADLRLGLSFIKEGGYHTTMVGIKKQKKQVRKEKQYYKMTMFLKYLEDIFNGYEMFNSAGTEPSMPQFRNAMNEGTIYDCINTYEAYKLHKDKDKIIEHVSELKCKNKYPFYMLRQDIENRQKKNKIS